MDIDADQDKEVTDLLDHMKAHFRTTSAPKSAEQLKQQKEELSRQLPQGTPIDEKLLSIATSLQMVETISLLSQARGNNFTGVNMYVDDEGSVRNAPLNTRASEIAHYCGKPLSVRGDAFLARVFDDGEGFARKDLKLNEIASSSEWVQQARLQSEQQRGRESAENVFRSMQRKPPVSQIQELTPALAAKEEGNQEFKKGHWQVAIDHYSKALEHDPGMIPALNNRAMARLKLEQWEEALNDCESVLAVESMNVKALLRASTALENLGNVEGAKNMCVDVLKLEPQNNEAKERLKRLS